MEKPDTERRANQMNVEEAKKAARNGRKVTHSTFTDEEYVFVNENGQLQDEKGYILDWFEFWDIRRQTFFMDEWSIYHPKLKTV